MITKYRPDIDGLRAIAVLPVVLFHFGYELFQGGFVGVDIFFVISGYLITKIIYKEIQEQNFSILQFYERRIRRIFPALFVVIGFSVVVGALILTPNDYQKLGRSVVTVTLFVSNILFWRESGYFDRPSEFKPLLHTWSLSVEEQFYIFFPLILVLIRVFFQSRFKYWISVLTIVSLLLSIYGVQHFPSTTFFWAHTRAWELLIGALLAINAVPHTNDSRLRNVISILGLVLICVSVFFYTSETAFPGASAMVPTIGAALLIYCGSSGHSIVSQILSARPLVFIGLISYSLYLWHWPLVVFTKYLAIRELTPSESGVLFLATLGVATLSWRYIEQPFRSKKIGTNRRQLFGVSAGVMASALFVGIWINNENGFRERFDIDVVEAKEDVEWKKWGKCQDRTPDKVSRDGLCQLGVSSVNPTFLLWGDSHARALATAIDVSASKFLMSGVVGTRRGCPPLMGIERSDQPDCHSFNDGMLEYVKSRPRLKTIFLVG